MRAFFAGFRLELRVIRASPDAFIPLVTAPIFGLIFLSIVRQSGRPDLQADALMAPVLMTLWWIALQHAGNMITGDRWKALLEPSLATPSSLALGALRTDHGAHVLRAHLVPRGVGDRAGSSSASRFRSSIRRRSA